MKQDIILFSGKREQQRERNTPEVLWYLVWASSCGITTYVVFSIVYLENMG